mgnify:CR=1 FL=1
MMLKSKIIIVLIFAFNSSFSQKLSSYIVNLEGDTINGEIKSSGDVESCSKIRFYNDKGEKEKFKPKHLKAYNISGVDYVTKQKERPISVVRPMKCFMKVLERGKVTLYQYNYMVQSGGYMGAGGVMIGGGNYNKIDYYLEKGRSIQLVRKTRFKKELSNYFKSNSQLSNRILAKDLRYNNIREIVNLLLLKGSIGKKGAGTCPVRGHSNVQGDRTMGIWEKPKDAFLDNLEKEFSFSAPRKHGYDVVAAIEAMHKKEAKVFIGMGGNFISATPDTEFTADALRNCDLTVQISTKLNRSHLITGKQALILPCLGRSEQDIQKNRTQFVSVENSMGVVHQSNGHLNPASLHLLSEPKIVAGIAEATLKNSKVEWNNLTDNYDLIRAKIEATINGFDNYNEKVRKKGGFYLPNNARDNNFTPTKTGKANFTTNLPSDIVLEQNQFMMMTIRTHDQYNTTIYGLNDRYRGVLNERRVIFMNPDDMKNQGLSKLDKVDLTSHFNNEKRIAKGFLVVPYSIPKQCTATYFPEANVLVPLKSKARISHTPASKTVIITIKKHD